MLSFCGAVYGTAEGVPLSKTFELDSLPDFACDLFAFGNI